VSVSTLPGELLGGEEVAYTGTEPACEAELLPLPEGVEPRLVAALRDQGIHSLFRHQAAAWEIAHRGEHLMLTTGTASGKTLAFNLPVLDAIVRDPKTRALYIYPTKALAQDQARSLAALGAPGVRPAIYDGDTPTAERRQVRTWANTILSNPDMLHIGVLPHHDRWGDVLANLRYVIVDEAHVYRGVFGSHVANVLRRLRRLAGVYGAEPQFFLASATIANSGELARELTGLSVAVVSDDGAPRAERTVVLWNPPVLDAELNLRASALGEAARLVAELVSHGHRTLCFAKSRKAAELIHRFALDRLGSEWADRLSPYRAGYTPAQRRGIERRLASGDLLGVSATDALELGIDIGLLDCVVSVGFPGTVSSLRQQWGRAGRRGHGLAVLVASDDALDQYFMREPVALLERRVEAAILDHTNPRVLDGHVLAAAFEAPIDDEDRVTLGDAALERAAMLPELRRSAAGFTWTGREYPAARVSLRSAGIDSVLVVESESGSVLGVIERERAYSTVHPGAVYLHLGESYMVRDLDLAAGVALVEPFAGDWYTQAKKDTTTAIEEVVQAAELSSLELCFGRVSVTEHVVAFQKRSSRDGTVLETVALDLPPATFDTESVWFVPDRRLLEGLEQMPKVLASLHAAEHALIAMLPLYAMCDRWDIGGLSTNVHFQTRGPTVFVYDGHPGGVGISERGFAVFSDWVADTQQLVAGCPCESGCPSCVQSPKCGNLNDMLDKAGAVELLGRISRAGDLRDGP
jgi:DEAD/DEAH box helicase domain-containing protein